MEYSIDLSGALLCYGPLAVMILGFIGFAWVTDADARRSYLRRIDMRTEDQAPQVLPPVVTVRTRAQTPSGSWVTIIPPGEAINGNSDSASVAFDNAPAAPVAAAPVSASAPAAPEPVVEAASTEDDLKRINGIGPKIEAALKAAGIMTFAQVSASDEAQLREILEQAEISLAPNIATWPEQAAELM